MKKIIRLNEQELVSLLKRVLMKEEQDDTNGVWGCYNFPENSESREWCECAVPKMKAKKQFLIRVVDYVKDLLKREEYNDLISNIKRYNRDDPFFSLRRSQFLEVESILTGTCNASTSKFEAFKKDIAKKAMFIEKKEDKEDYSPLNKLNTNYTALSFLLTSFRNENNMGGQSFEDIFQAFFSRNEKQTEQGKESLFVTFIIDYFSKKEKATELMRKVFKTIERTTGIGVQSEKEAFVLLTKKFGDGNVRNYSGDYSFVDLFGIDFLVKGFPDFADTYLPVQVKSKEKDLYGNDRVCENIAMGKEDYSGRWIFKLYNGNRFIKTLSI